MMELTLFILLVTFGVFVQAAAGFGGTLIAMPLGILLVGVGVAKPVMTIIAFLTGLMVMITDFKYINWKELAKMAGVMLVGVLLGLWVFHTQQLTYLLVIYGVIVVAIGVKKLFFPKLGHAPRLIQEIALVLAGVMQGMFVSGGSFLAVYAVERLPEKREFRSTINAVWAILNIFLIGSYWKDGMLGREVLLASALSVVPAFIVIWLAGILAKKLKQETFLKITYLVLIASGTVLLLSNL